MHRRTFLKTLASTGSLAALGAFPAPAISQGAAAKTLRFVPQANLANFDPDLGHAVRRAQRLGAGLGHALRRRRQARSRSGRWWRARRSPSDGLTWTFKLRPGLKFHDGEPVLAKDVVASLTRWTRPRLHGPDDQGHPEGADRRRRPHLQVGAVRSPIPKMLFALGKNNTPMRLHHAGAHRQDRSVQADHRVHRQRPDEVRAQRMGAGRQGGVREVRATTCRATSRRLVARRRQEDAASTASSG